ncbi:transketolase [Patescibacteria group bacterium]|nr:transketolase [Patescibacteria group bacterium]MBU1934928.1 transketolase [Patescibacteria group bacterium]
MTILDEKTLALLEYYAYRVRWHSVDMARDKLKMHFGAVFSISEIMVELYFNWMRYDSKNPSWKDRDRFVLSKGHAAPNLYICLAEAGFFSISELRTFRSLNSILQGHPCRLKTPGVEVSSGSLGTGIAAAVGMAIAGKMEKSLWRVYVVISDAECNEGSTWEAIQVASNHHLGNMTVLLDRNGMSAGGSMKNRNDIEPLIDKWRAFNWAVRESDGHDFQQLHDSLEWSETITDQPKVIICHTEKGRGVPVVRTQGEHNFALSTAQYQQSLIELAEVEKELKYHGN